MPFALVTIGLLLVIVGFQNTYKQFGAQVAGDFTGSGNFFYWIIAIGLIGALGYNKTLQPFSRAFLALIVIGIFLAGKGQQGQGFFSAFSSGIKSGSSTTPLPAGGTQSTNTNTASSGSGGFDLSNIGQDVSIGETIASFL